MSGGAWFALGALAGVAFGALALRASDTWCCDQVNKGARDKLAGYAGPFSDLVSGALDATGGTKLLGGLVQGLGLGN